METKQFNTRRDLNNNTTLREWFLMRHVLYAADAVRFAGTTTGRLFGRWARENLASANEHS